MEQKAEDRFGKIVPLTEVMPEPVSFSFETPLARTERIEAIEELGDEKIATQRQRQRLVDEAMALSVELADRRQYHEAELLRRLTRRVDQETDPYIKRVLAEDLLQIVNDTRLALAALHSLGVKGIGAIANEDIRPRDKPQVVEVKPARRGWFGR